MNNFRKGDWMSEQFEVLIDNDKLMKRVKEMAEELDKEYAGKTVHLIGILKGSVFFILFRFPAMVTAQSHQE